MSARRPPRLTLFDYRGFYRYFVTCCVADRRQAFVSDAIVGPLVLQILHACSSRQFAALAYVFMPDHLHLLVEGTAPDADFRTFMRYLRRRMALEYRRCTLLDLWQDGYFERVLRHDEATPQVIAYILENPVRAGLVQDPAEYPFAWTIDPAACVSVRDRGARV